MLFLEYDLKQMLMGELPQGQMEQEAECTGYSFGVLCCFHSVYMDLPTGH